MPLTAPSIAFLRIASSVQLAPIATSGGMRLQGFIWLVAFAELVYPRQTNACRHSQATSMGHYYHHWFWKDPADQSKGALWAYIHSDYASKYGIGTAAYTRSGPAPENGRYFFTASKNHRSKGKKWSFFMQDGSRFTCRTHTAATYVRVKAWCQTWQVVPVKIEEVKKPTASPRDATKWDLIYRVYFVRLLSFEATAAGKSYYKIGKAKVVPKRIKQFGPCELLDVLEFEHSREAFEAEASLHGFLHAHRIPSTELFMLELSAVRDISTEFERLRTGIEQVAAYRILDR